MKEGSITLVAMPQSDGATKRRPALLLKQMPPFEDWLVCGISTQLHQQVADFDLILKSDAPYFSQTGLQRTSLVRLGFLAVVPPSQIVGSIGEIPEEMRRLLLQRLARFLSA